MNNFGREKNNSVLVATCSHAMDAKNSVHDYKPVGGCGRVYVDLGKMRKGSKAMATVSLMLGRVCERPGSNRHFLYVGYDNATGREFAQGEAIAASFRADGFYAYCDGDSD